MSILKKNVFLINKWDIIREKVTINSIYEFREESMKLGWKNLI